VAHYRPLADRTAAGSIIGYWHHTVSLSVCDALHSVWLIDTSFSQSVWTSE